MSSIEEIISYDVDYYGGGMNATGYQYRAIIGLRRANGSLIGAAYFHRDPSTLPPTDEQKPGGYIWCHYPWDSFAQVLDLLRNESPVYLRYVGANWQVACITTSIEPVGESE
ncbi:MAG: hypothetical protein R3B59_11445 [Dehalococcoidia bacterium]